ncbi:MAG: formate--tetrahydrofolate ligase [Deltaproteobacteria bacterium]|nr:formate--tetrahydrofolate ligase [Deltaproteobacteria bacterium]
MPADIDIARSVTPRPIEDVAADLGVSSDHLLPYGRDKAKIVAPLPATPRGKLILVSAMTPTKAGEGKTTTSVGLAQGLGAIGKKGCVVLREPSLGPIMGMKGGAAGGGYSQVIPMDDINLHFTGDFHAITAAHNLLSAALDNHLHQGNALDIEPRTVIWRRVLDMNDRALRNVVLGLGGRTMGVPRESGFDITAASEIMAILCLSEDFDDLQKRLGGILIGQTRGTKEGVYARDLEVGGAMAVLLKDAVYPNLVQTLEGTPAIIHGGPFANIAQGTNSVIATKTGLAHADYVVTEAGFGFDLGAEKFLDIKCVSAGLKPSCVVLVATIRALKLHGGVKFKDLGAPNAAAVAAGLPNLERHLDSLNTYEITPVVAINHFGTDTAEEIAIVEQMCRDRGIRVALNKGFADGGQGAMDLAREVVEVVDAAVPGFKPLYDWDAPVKEKIERVCAAIYGAKGVVYTKKAEADLRRFARLGLSGLPICMAKTPASLSDDPKLLGRPTDFVITVREVEAAAGAGFLIPITGAIMRMPGLPKVPAANRMYVDEAGEIHGLS